MGMSALQVVDVAVELTIHGHILHDHVVVQERLDSNVLGTSTCQSDHSAILAKGWKEWETEETSLHSWDIGQQ